MDRIRGAIPGMHGTRRRVQGPSSTVRDTEADRNDRQQVGFPQAATLEELPEAISSAKDHAIEVLLRQPKLATDSLLVLVVKVEADQHVPVPRNRHLLEHAARRPGPLRPPDPCPVGVVFGVPQILHGVGARGWRAVLAAMIPQVIESHAVKITAQILRVREHSAEELLKRTEVGGLQNVRGNLGIANPPQDQGPKTRIVAIDCRQVGNRVRYRRGEIGLRGEDRYGCSVVIDTGHERSISRRRGTRQPRTHRRRPAWLLLTAMVLAGWATSRAEASMPCTAAPGAPARA